MRLALFPLALLCLLTTDAAAFRIIDDFEVAGFDHSTSGVSVIDTLEVTGAGHVIHSPRIILMTPLGGGAVSATLTPGADLDDRVVVDFTGEGLFASRYDWGFPADLTSQGTYDRIEIDLPGVIPGGDVRVFLDDDNDGLPGQVEIVQVFDPGTVTIPLANFTAADPTRATKLNIQVFSNGESGRFEIASARISRHQSGGPFFVPVWPEFAWPPGPPPVQFQQLDEVGQLQFLAFLRMDAWYPPDPVIHAQWMNVPSYGAHQGQMQFLYEGATEFATSVGFSFEFQQFGSLIPAISGTPAVESTESGFAMTFPVLLSPDGGPVVSSSLTQIRISASPHQPLLFSNPAATVFQTRGGTGTTVSVMFDLETTAGIDEALPLFELEWMADTAPGTTPTAAVELPAMAVSGVSLRAMPAITRGATSLQLGRVRASETTLDIWDVSGRRIRELAIPAGDLATTWDGRTLDGRPTVSGVYFIRVRGVPGSEATRVVRIR